jgi:hypothetical protein
MTSNQFYENLLDEIAVPLSTMTKARTKRDQVGTIVAGEIRKRLGTAVRVVSVGALSQGTQTAPLNDFDLVIEIEKLKEGWLENPQGALNEVMSWIEPLIDGKFETSAHAIKITFRDCEFTADIVLGLKQEKGILIPHCPDNEPHRWIRTDPEKHKLQVLARNKQLGSSDFTRQIRILKWLNEYLQLVHELDKKPLSSFHMTALALKLLTAKDSHAEWTPFFLEQSAVLVMQPLEDPAGVGDPLKARDPAFVSNLMRDAAAKTRYALTAPAEEVEAILRGVFGYPKKIRDAEEQPTVGVGIGGVLGAGAGTAHRHTPTVRSHGDGDQ